MPGLSKILIANRGEIAVRIINTARALGYRTVAVYSEADAEAPHVRLADEAVCIGPAPSRESYLRVEGIVEAAERTGADAIHPGYGFLAENPRLAARCEEQGIAFVGPPAEAIRLMGDKANAKTRMMEAGVPCVPGYLGERQDEQTFVEQAREVGFPLLIKAAVGGGGRGMRAVRQEADLPVALASARSESEAAFGNGDLLLEKLIHDARHVEIQVFADTLGHAVHLGERECSIQRRHQKIIEESPSPAVNADLRERMGAAAVKAARAIGYVGAGTVEFLLDQEGQFYFMEMNTRLQVEHPVTEMVTGLDLVAWQLCVAEGGPLPLSQDQITFSGHAIEARIYAEDPYAGFLPQAGEVQLWRPARATGVRVDAGIAQGQEVSPHYDPLVAKVIAHGETREIARRRLAAAVEDSVLLGPTTNRALLSQLLRDQEFVEGEMTTATLDRRFASDPPPRPSPDPQAWALAAVLHSLSGAGWPDPWRSSAGIAWPVVLESPGESCQLQVDHQEGQKYSVKVEEVEVMVELMRREAGCFRHEVDGVQQEAHFVRSGDQSWLDVAGVTMTFEEPPPAASKGVETGEAGCVRAPMSGQVISIAVQQGETLEPGACVAVLEAMKMEHRVVCSGGGMVESVSVKEGDQVSSRQVLMTISEEGAAPQEPEEENQ